MNQCVYCRTYHTEHTVCDDYINKLKDENKRLTELVLKYKEAQDHVAHKMGEEYMILKKENERLVDQVKQLLTEKSEYKKYSLGG